jgi:hypothetical protein
MKTSYMKKIKWREEQEICSVHRIYETYLIFVEKLSCTVPAIEI